MKRFSLAALVAAGVVTVTLQPWALHAVHADSVVKAQIGGLIDRSAPPAAAYASVVDGWVVQANWSDLQPSQGGSITADNVIDQAISAARSAGARLKVRVFAGDGAPDWAKTLDGAAMRICDNSGSPCGTVGRFWTANFRDAYVDLQNKLAVLYDGVDVVREVTIDRCTTLNAEPLLREFNYAPNLTAYRSAGYTLAADEQCQREQVDAHQVWANTRSSFAFNPYQSIAATSTSTDEAFTESMMDYCRSSLASRCVLGNNSLRDTSQTTGYDPMYNAIKARGRPIYFQTAGPQKIRSLANTIQLGIGYGAGMIELPDSYTNSPASSYTTSDAQLEALAVPAGADPTSTTSTSTTATSTSTTSTTVVAGTPLAPRKFRVRNTSKGLRLTWLPPSSAGSASIMGYAIYRGPPGAETLLTTVKSRAFTDSSAVEGTAYDYMVAAVNAVGQGPRTLEVTGQKT